MKSELQNKIFKKYPNIFKQKDLSMQETAMCWGISCGDGWYDLIDELCANIKNRVENVNRNNPNEEFICQAVQVKEKYGGLRFYLYGGDDYICGLIAMAESMSYKTCSDCGNKAIHLDEHRGWIYTLCNACTNEKG